MRRLPIVLLVLGGLALFLAAPAVRARLEPGRVPEGPPAVRLGLLGVGTMVHTRTTQEMTIPGRRSPRRTSASPGRRSSR